MSKMTKDEAVAAMQGGHADRALIYMGMFRELKKRYGKAEAIDVMRTALYEHGKGFGETLRGFAPGNFKGLYEAFALVPDGGEMFSPKQEKCDDECFKVHFMSCPLQKAWRDAGVDEDELVDLLHCASALDVGTMDAAGFDLDIQTWKPGEVGCCKLKVTKRRG